MSGRLLFSFPQSQAILLVAFAAACSATVGESQVRGRPGPPAAPELATRLERAVAGIADENPEPALEELRAILEFGYDGFDLPDSGLSRRAVSRSVKSQAIDAVASLPEAAATRWRLLHEGTTRSLSARVREGGSDLREVERQLLLDSRSPAASELAERVAERLVDGGRIDLALSLLRRYGIASDRIPDLAAAQSRVRGPHDRRVSLVPRFRWVLGAKELSLADAENAPLAEAFASGYRVPSLQFGSAGPLRVFAEPPHPDGSPLAIRDVSNGSLRWRSGTRSMPSRVPPAAEAALRDPTQPVTIGDPSDGVRETLRWHQITADTCIIGDVVVSVVGEAGSRSLRGFDSSTGQLLWIAEPRMWPSTSTEAKIVSSPIGDRRRGRAFVCIDGGSHLDLVSLDAATGQWETSQTVANLIAPVQTPSDLVEQDGRVYVRHETQIAAVDTVTRQLLWHSMWRGPYAQRSGLGVEFGADPTLAEGWRRPWLSVDRDGVVATSRGRQLVSLDTSTGERAWQRTYDELQGVDAVTSDTIFASGPDRLAAIERSDGTTRWVTRIDAEIVAGPGLVERTRWVVPTVGGDLIVVDRESGRVVARTPTGLTPPGGLTLRGDDVYLSHPQLVARFATEAEVEADIERLTASADPREQDRGRSLRALRSLVDDEPEAAVADLTAAATTGEREAMELLAQTLLPLLPDRFADYRESIGAVDPERLEPELRQSWHRALAEAYAASGDAAAEFAQWLEVVTLPPNDRLVEQDRSWSVREDRLLATQIADRFRMAAPEQRAVLQELVADFRTRRTASDRARLRRLPQQLLSASERQAMSFGPDVPAATQAENALRWPDRVGVDPSLLATAAAAATERDRSAVDWMRSPRLTLAAASSVQPIYQSEVISSDRFGPPRLWTLGPTGEVAAHDGFGRTLGVLRDRVGGDWGGRPLAILRRGLTTQLVYARGLQQVMRPSAVEAVASPLPVWDLESIGPFAARRVGQMRVESDFASSPPADGPLVVAIDGTLRAGSSHPPHVGWWWLRTDLESVTAIASDRDFVCIVNGPHTFALDATTGRRLERRPLPAPLLQESLRPGIRVPSPTTVAAVDHRFLLRDRESLRLYDPVAGETNWTRELDPQAAVYRHRLDELVLLHPDGRIERIDAPSGRVRAATRVPAWKLGGGPTDERLVADLWVGGGPNPALMLAAGTTSKRQAYTGAASDLRLIRLTDEPKTTWSRDLPSCCWPGTQPAEWPVTVLVRSGFDRSRVSDFTSSAELVLIDNATGKPVLTEPDLPGTDSFSWRVRSLDTIDVLMDRASVTLTPSGRRGG